MGQGPARIPTPVVGRRRASGAAIFWAHLALGREGVTLSIADERSRLTGCDILQ